MLWIKFSKEQPTKDGKYLIAYNTTKWRDAIWEKGKWLGDPDEYGYHTLYDPLWWANVTPPQPNKGGHYG